jgi:DnaJ-class molecular chaperone
MSADASDTPDIPCPPCRGTGKVISNLGGEAHEVDCPWCEGSGRFIAGHDAQAAHRGGERPAPPPAD